MQIDLDTELSYDGGLTWSTNGASRFTFNGHSQFDPTKGFIGYDAWWGGNTPLPTNARHTLNITGGTFSIGLQAG